MMKGYDFTMGIVERYSTDHIAFPYLGIDFNISPTAFTLFGLEIKWYGICIAIGLFLAMHYCFKRTKDFGLDGEALSDAVIAGIIGAVIGARAYYVIFHAEDYHDIKEIFAIRDGGLAVYGGLIGALIFGCIVCRIKKIHILSAVDLASMGFFIGQACGRWGNFFNQECFGLNTTLPWGISGGRIQNFIINNRASFAAQGFEMDPYTAVHPCFLYESLLCICGFLLVHFFYKHRKFDGEMICIYVTIYGFGRFIIEGLRTDSLYIGNIRVSQALSLLICIAGIVIIILGHIRAKKKGVSLFADSETAKELLRKADERDKAYEESKKNKKAKELAKDQKIIDDEEE